MKELIIREAIKKAVYGTDSESQEAIIYLNEVGDITDIIGYIETGDFSESELLDWFGLD